MKKCTPLTVALVILLGIVNLAGQRPAKGSNNQVEITANLMVLDGADRFVSDVKAEDLRLFENDVEQMVVSLEKNPPNVSLMLVVDNTGSMRSKIDRIVQAAGIAVVNLNEGDEAAIVRFVGGESIEIYPDWTRNRDDLLKAVNNLFIAGGQSAVIDALFLALEKSAEARKIRPERRFAMLLISDAEDRASYHSAEQLFALADSSSIPVYSLALTGGLSDQRNSFGIRNSKTTAETLVHQTAFLTGGNAHTLSENFSESEMLARLKSILIELRSQYSVKYRSTNTSRDGLSRKLRIELKDSKIAKKRKLAFREAVVVPKDISFK
ncbi:MAG: VWA domain-containing protein [Blastocatellia bacterium]